MAGRLFCKEVMMRQFELNGKAYEHMDIDFGMFCDFEEEGISISNMNTRIMQFLRLYIAKCMKKSVRNATVKDAEREIKAHLANGGTFEGLMEIFEYATSHSSFFQAIQKGEGQGSTEGEEAQVSRA